MTKGNILITGVSTGIGYYAAKKFIEEGYTVYGSVRKQEDADRVKSELGENLKPLLFDVTNHEAINESAKKLVEELNDQGLKCLINNSGVAISGPMEVLDVDAYRYQFEVNYFGMIAVTKAFLPLLGADKNSNIPAGKIINISSISGRTCMPFLTPYSSSKAAVDRFSEGLRRELMIYGIDVITMNPGAVVTPIWEKAKEPNEAMMNSNYAKSISIFYHKFIKSMKDAVKVEDFVDRLYKKFTQNKPSTFDIMMKGKFTKYYLPKYFLSARMYDRFIKKALKM